MICQNQMPVLLLECSLAFAFLFCLQAQVAMRLSTTKKMIAA
jgi:hypothetical protein